jgi:hypothetical protein
MEIQKESPKSICLQPMIEIVEAMNRALAEDAYAKEYEHYVPATVQENCFDDVSTEYGDEDCSLEADEELSLDDVFSEVDSEELFSIKGYERQDQFRQPHLHSQIIKRPSSNRALKRRRADRWHKSNIHLQLERAISSCEQFEKNELWYAIKAHKFWLERRAEADENKKKKKKYSFRPTGRPGEWEVVYL